MKTKAEQLEELKATAVKLQQQIEALEKPKQWEPRGEFYALHHSLPTSTVEAAAKATTNIRTHNRLLAYVAEFGGDWEADWEDWKQEKCYVCFNNHEISQKWKWSRAFNSCMGGTVYMSRECAIALAAKLNSGEVTL